MKQTAFFAALFLLSFAMPGLAAPQPGIAMHGQPKYQGDFHFSYTNPDAPKGGALRLHSLGTFDTLNPFILKGTAAPGLTPLGQGYLYDSLMVQSEDEPFSVYPLLAKTIDVAQDRASVTFELHEKARFHDGKHVTADDAVWTFNTFMKDGSPFYKAYFADVKDVKATGERTVTFTFNHNRNRELPLILAQLPVLPKHYWGAGAVKFAETTLTPPVGSGPYKIKSVDPGRRIVYERVADYWAKDLPVNRGRFNFDTLSIDIYRDPNVALEAFFSNQYDVRDENVAKLWATAYDAPPMKDGRVKRADIPNQRPQGMQAFVVNMRRPVFADIHVREALNYAFDYEWSNKQFAYGTYTRTDSFFENTPLASSGLPEGREKALLEPFKDQLPESVFTKPYTNPVSDGSGNNRDNLKAAAKILDDAGYVLGKDGIRVHKDTGTRLSFEIIDNNPMLERWILPFIRNLKKIGVDARYRLIDPAQFQTRMQNFDYDMTCLVIGQSSSPGNEQRDLWGSDKADIPGSRNYIGIKNKAVDALTDALIEADTIEELQAATRALDRVLLHNHYVIPQWHYGKFRVAWWDRFGRPEQTSPLSTGADDTWWQIKK